MSCISPMAPLRETACGLKFDSTLTTARTRFASTPWRWAAASMALSTVSGLSWRCWPISPGRTGCEPTKVRLPPRPGFGEASRLSTSRAAWPAAFMVDELLTGTGFQRCSLLLHYTRPLERDDTPVAGPPDLEALEG